MSSSPLNPFFHFTWKDLRDGPARDALQRFFAKGADDETRVHLARQVLSRPSVIAHCMLFDVFQQMSMDSQRGPANPLEELLGPMRVKAVHVLRRPDPRGAKHAAAAQIIARTARPKDIPLLLALLERSSHSELPFWMYWALSVAVRDLESADTTLIAAMERRIEPGLSAKQDRIDASSILEQHRVKPAEEALLRVMPKLDPDEAIPVVTALLEHDPVRHLPLALRIRDGLPKGYPSDDERDSGMSYPYSVFIEAIEEAEEKGAEEMAHRARIAQLREKIEQDPRAALPLLPREPTREEGEALTPALCRALAKADDALAPMVLRALRARPAPTWTLFHAIEPWLMHENLELRQLALQVALASRSDQARARLRSRLRRARASDVADACTILRALAEEDRLYGAESEIALSSPLPEVRALASSLIARGQSPS